ncbi:MAG: hypothetical protein ACYTHJ_00625 [Planctomycetota bacterium]
MIRKPTLLVAAAVMTAGTVLAISAGKAVGDPPSRGDAVVYVTSQGLYFDSQVNGPLPPHGSFQLLEMGPNGLQTEFGPGTPGYLGGRWMMDSDGDGEIDTYFSCPLLPPGRETP